MRGPFIGTVLGEAELDGAWRIETDNGIWCVLVPARELEIGSRIYITPRTVRGRVIETLYWARMD